MNSSPLFLHQILIPSLPNFQSGGGFCPFLKVYQSLQLLYTSGVYDPQSSSARKLCVTLEPALLLKGDIMVKCYHRRTRTAEREVVFRVQFHTCTVHGAQLWFGKTELDVACTDDRFPPDATVEFIFSSGPDKMKVHGCLKNDIAVKVEYNTSDPVVRWDSYENFNLRHQDSMENISHTRGPLDGSLYAQVRKRRGPGSTASAVSPNGCLNSSPTVKPQVQLRESSNLTAPHERETIGCSSKTGDKKDSTNEKTRGLEKERETEILDDGSPSSPERLRQDGSCCHRAGMRCQDVAWEKEKETLLSNGHYLSQCNSIKKHPKSQTLPALPSKSMSSPTHVELCHRHSAHPLPKLPWEHPPPPPPPLPCLHRPFYHYPSTEHTQPHSHTLPASNRLCTGEECHVFHYSSHGPSPHISHQSLPSSPYREMFFSSPTPSSGCLCRECSSRRDRHSLRSSHTLHSEQSENPHWSPNTGIQQAREGTPLWESENPWEVSREAEFWQRKPAVPAYRVCPTAFSHSPNSNQPRIIARPHQGYSSPQSLMDLRDGASSGYHTPPQPPHSCPCSSYQSSPAESHESRGYVSGYHSGSASPLFTNSPSQGQSRIPEITSASRNQQHSDHHKVEKVQTDVEDDISHGSDGKSDSNGQSSSHGLDSDHDYTLIGGSSPTHTEDSVTVDSTPQSQETTDSTHLEPSRSGNKATTALLTKTYNQRVNISKSTAQGTHEHAQSTSTIISMGSTKVTGSAERPKRSEASGQPSIIIPCTPVQVQLNGSVLPVDTHSDTNRVVNTPSSFTSAPSYQNSPVNSPELRSSPQCSPRTPDTDSSANIKPPSPVPDGYNTPTFPLASYYYPLLNVPRVPYTGYTAVTIPTFQPPLPEKKRLSSTPGSVHEHNSLLQTSSAPTSPLHVTFSSPVGEQSRGSSNASWTEESEIRVNAKFVQDSSKYWYKPGITRDQAIAVLKDKEPGMFLIRDSNSFQGAYGLALKVATPPPNAHITGSKGDPLEQLVRHFLIETGPRGVKIKGCQNESYFGSLSALVYQHSITPISLPCVLQIPEKDLVGELQETQSVTSTSTAADLLKQGAACSVLYLNSVETESLTGPEAVSKATKCTLALSPRPVATVVHFKVSTQGITLTDSKRRLFFRRHYPINSVTFSSVDPQDKRWTNSDNTPNKMFGFVARRTGSTSENVCHLFAEMDPEQPAVAIVNFINKVMLGPQLRR
ncbi:tensin-2-like isoform X1 [Thalassophryne amazonica]|nr:tensin-2-like isoform X1 [Thalassophryne amazonica]